MYREHLDARIQGLIAGEEFSLVELFGNEWNEEWSQGEKRNLGTQFRQAFESGQFPFIEFVGIAKAGRHNVYRRIKT